MSTWLLVYYHIILLLTEDVEVMKHNWFKSGKPCRKLSGLLACALEKEGLVSFIK